MGFLYFFIAEDITGANQLFECIAFTEYEIGVEITLIS